MIRDIELLRDIAAEASCSVQLCVRPVPECAVHSGRDLGFLELSSPSCPCLEARRTPSGVDLSIEAVDGVSIPPRALRYLEDDLDVLLRALALVRDALADLQRNSSPYGDCRLPENFGFTLTEATDGLDRLARLVEQEESAGPPHLLPLSQRALAEAHAVRREAGEMARAQLAGWLPALRALADRAHEDPEWSSLLSTHCDGVHRDEEVVIGFFPLAGYRRGTDLAEVFMALASFEEGTGTRRRVLLRAPSWVRCLLLPATRDLCVVESAASDEELRLAAELWGEASLEEAVHRARDAFARM